MRNNVILLALTQVAKELEGAREQADADTKMILRQVEKDSDEMVAMIKKESSVKKKHKISKLGFLSCHLLLWHITMTK